MSENKDPLKLAEELGKQLGSKMERMLKDIEEKPKDKEADLGAGDKTKTDIPGSSEKSPIDLTEVAEEKGKENLPDEEKRLFEAREKFLFQEKMLKEHAGIEMDRWQKIKAALGISVKPKDSASLKEWQELAEKAKTEHAGALTDYGKKLYGDKLAALSEAEKTLGKIAEIKAEILESVIFGEYAKLNEGRLARLPEKEAGLTRKILQKYGELPMGIKLAISSSVATGFAFFTAPAMGLVGAGTYFGWRLARAAVGTGAGVAAGKGYSWVFDKIAGTKDIRQKSEEKIKSEIKEESWYEDDFGKVFEETFESTSQKLDALAKKEKRIYLAKAIGQAAVIGGAAGLTSWGLGKAFRGLGLTPDVKIGTKAAAPSSPGAPEAAPGGARPGGIDAATSRAGAGKFVEVLPIGSRGPEGAIIDYFKTNPGMAEELSKKFGLEGKTDIGKLAHQLWLKSVDGELAKPGMADKLTAQGFTADAEGYAKAMHRLGKGFVELDTQGNMRLSDNTSFLRAAPETAPPAPFESPAPEAVPLPDDSQAPDQNPIDLLSDEAHDKLVKKAQDLSKEIKKSIEDYQGSNKVNYEIDFDNDRVPRGASFPNIGDDQAVEDSLASSKGHLAVDIQPPPDPEHLRIKEAVARLVEPGILNDKTFKAAAKVTLGKILENVPPEVYEDKYSLSRYWNGLSQVGVKTPDLPGSGWLGLNYDDFRKYAEMAKFLRENPVLKSAAGLKNMTVEEFFELYGGDLKK